MRRRGRFVLVSSSQAQRPDATNAAYAAAKAAAEAWTLAMARDLGEHGGTANVLVVHAIGDKPTFTPGGRPCRRRSPSWSASTAAG